MQFERTAVPGLLGFLRAGSGALRMIALPSEIAKGKESVAHLLPSQRSNELSHKCPVMGQYRMDILWKP